MTHSIGVIDRKRLVRAALAEILNGDRLRVAAEYDSLEDLLKAGVGDIHLDLILACLPASPHSAEDEIRALAAACRAWPQTPIVVLADNLSLEQLVATFRAGAKGYLLKDTAAQTLEEALVLVLLGESVFPSHLGTLLAHDRKIGETYRAVSLTEKDMLILRHVAQGHSTKQIARDEGISEIAVKTGTKALFRKLGVMNRTEAAIWALRNLE